MSRVSATVRCAAVFAAGALVSVGCLPFPGQAPVPVDVAKGLRAEYVVSGAARPAALALAPDGRVFYTEKNTGRIRVIAEGALLEEPFAELPVNCAGDRGLLGIALHPNFNLNRRIYVFYTRSDTGQSSDDPPAVVDNRVVYFEAQGNLARDGEIFVASLPVGSGTKRVGGRIGFAPDGTLFVALGDLTQTEAAQAVDLLPGKVLRYHDDGTVPLDNPVAGSPVYARGLRDPRGLTFDPQSDVAFVTDRNENGSHEINRILAGRNYGWPEVVGRATTPAELAFAAENPDYVDPLLESGSERSVFEGAAFNPSTKYGSDARLQFFYGLRDKGRVRSLQLTAQRTAAVKSESFATGLPTPITDMAFSPAGTLYVASADAVLRVVPIP